MTEFAGAVAIDTAGLPVYPRRAIVVERDNIRWKNGVPMFRCAACWQYKEHIRFDCERLYRQVTRCYKCVSEERQARTERGGDLPIRPRLRCMGLDGNVRFYCKLCGHYVSGDMIDPSRVEKRRSICDRCHHREFLFNIHRRDKYVRPCMLNRDKRRLRSLFGICPKCKGFSPTRGMCSPCANGAPPILGRSLGQNVPTCIFNVNAAFLFTAKHAKPRNNATTVKAGSQSAHASWSKVPDCLVL